MGITKENDWRNKSIFASLLLMLACLFISRVALSASMIFFFILTIFHKSLFQQFKQFGGNIFLICISLLFFIPLISGLWSTNLQEWIEVVRIKLPLLLFPVAFAGSWTLTEKQWKTVAAFFLMLIFLGCCWSLGQYFQNFKGVQEGYLKAKVLNTPLENDHIRFSWLVAVGIICCILLKEKVQQKAAQIILLGLVIFYACYLHVLAARMGLLCFYVFVLIYAIWAVLKKVNVKRLFLFIGFGLLPLLAWLSLPTFQNRIKYIVYDLSNVRAGVYQSGSNDGARLLSMQAGWDVLQQYPLGTGAGDLKFRINEWYNTYVPNLSHGERFLPCNEWLIYGGFAGWIGILLLSVTLLVPFVRPVKHDIIFWHSLNAIVVFSFLFDMSIEAQFGVFIYSAIVLWWWKWLNKQSTHE